MTGSRKKESSASVPRRGQPGPAQSAASRIPTFCTQVVFGASSFSTELAFSGDSVVKKKIPKPCPQKLINLPLKYGQLLFFRPYIRNFSSFLICFIHNRVGVVPTPSSRCISSADLIRLDAVGPDVHGLAALTSTLACLRIKIAFYFHFQYTSSKPKKNRDLRVEG